MASPNPATDIIAKPSREYRIKRYIIVLMFIVLGAWFAYDGFVNWPRENVKFDQMPKDIEKARASGDDLAVRKLEDERSKLKKHTDTDLMFQKVLGFGLPPLGLIMLAYALYNSRGQYRLRGNILNIPGHPPIPLDSIRAIDKTYWDRKGIAHLKYELANGQSGNARLDDFIYDRPPTDEIFKIIEEFTGTGDKAADTEPAPQA